MADSFAGDQHPLSETGISKADCRRGCPDSSFALLHTQADLQAGMNNRMMPREASRPPQGTNTTVPRMATVRISASPGTAARISASPGTQAARCSASPGTAACCSITPGLVPARNLATTLAFPKPFSRREDAIGDSGTLQQHPHSRNPCPNSYSSTAKSAAAEAACNAPSRCCSPASASTTR